MYTVKVTIKEEISEKERAARISQFQQAFVSAATDYYAEKAKIKSKKNSA